MLNTDILYFKITINVLIFLKEVAKTDRKGEEGRDNQGRERGRQGMRERERSIIRMKPFGR